MRGLTRNGSRGGASRLSKSKLCSLKQMLEPARGARDTACTARSVRQGLGGLKAACSVSTYLSTGLPVAQV